MNESIRFFGYGRKSHLSMMRRVNVGCWRHGCDEPRVPMCVHAGWSLARFLLWSPVWSFWYVRQTSRRVTGLVVNRFLKNMSIEEFIWIFSLPLVIAVLLVRPFVVRPHDETTMRAHRRHRVLHQSPIEGGKPAVPRSRLPRTTSRPPVTYRLYRNSSGSRRALKLRKSRSV